MSEFFLQAFFIWQDDTSSVGSHGEARSKRRKKTPGRTTFKYASHLREEHGQALFGVQFNPHVDDRDIFATCGTNRVRNSFVSSVLGFTE